MSAIQIYPLPEQALLRRYLSEASEQGTYTDCYAAEIFGKVALPEFVFAFYTTWVFRLERVILKYLAQKGSTDDDAFGVANGRIDTFAAWEVEDRTHDQLLMCDFRGRTRSWFMVSHSSDKTTTRLWFGSAVVPIENTKTGRRELGKSFDLLLGFHKVYSRLLLYSARLRVAAR